ncbi:MAG: hypothetical protein V2I97_08785 [Desulfococcaceae bacterium]|jgi:hypothetical protein|nr:hypothetical protein [Desulfococcaceae bacterium]
MKKKGTGPMPGIFLLFSVFTLFFSVVSAYGISGDSYDFPISDPLMATIAGTPPDEELKEVLFRERVYGIEIFQDKELPPTLRNIREYRFSLAYHKGKEVPLIFIIPGTGSNYKSGKVKMLQNAFYNAGFHVICLNSPFTRRFAVMGSSSNIPGISREDAKDIYRIMRMAYEKIRRRVAVREFFLTGYSLGGLNSAFVAEVDEQEKLFNFRKVLLINPPVDLFTSTKIFDDYVTRNLRDRADIFFDNIFEKASRYFEYKGDVYIDEEFLYDINRIAPLQPHEMEGLIGAAFRLALANVVFTVDMLTDGGYIKNQNEVITLGTSVTPHFKKVLHWTFEDYLEKILLPHWQRKYPGQNRENLIRNISLRALEGYLKASRKIAVVHNADDIILGKGDLDFLRSTFGNRARIYPGGGHLGNILYGPNVEYMLDFFKN